MGADCWRGRNGEGNHSWMSRGFALKSRIMLGREGLLLVSHAATAAVRALSITSGSMNRGGSGAGAAAGWAPGWEGGELVLVLLLLLLLLGVGLTLGLLLARVRQMRLLGWRGDGRCIQELEDGSPAGWCIIKECKNRKSGKERLEVIVVRYLSGVHQTHTKLLITNGFYSVMPRQPMMVMRWERVIKVAMSDTYTALTWCPTPPPHLVVTDKMSHATSSFSSRRGTPC